MHARHLGIRRIEVSRKVQIVLHPVVTKSVHDMAWFLQIDLTKPWHKRHKGCLNTQRKGKRAASNSNIIPAMDRQLESSAGCGSCANCYPWNNNSPDLQGNA